jgi:hypothetical protein
MTALVVMFIVGAIFGFCFRWAYCEASAADRLEAMRGLPPRRTLTRRGAR